MRNLKTIALEETVLPAALPLTATAWDTSNNSIICAFGPTSTQPIIELKRKKACGEGAGDLDIQSLYETITSWDAPCPLPDLECDGILLLQYFADTATACLVLAGGDLVVVRETPNGDQEKIEIVGSVDAGIAAAAWAPDEELLAVVTRADTLILMSRDFELITEATLTREDLKASKHVSVGWGKKETQFQGKRAKALRDPTMPESMDEGTLSPLDDGRVSVSWRGDGAFFAVNSIVKDERRVVRVFTREAVLDSASEPIDGLESTLTWRPAGSLLAGAQRRNDRVDIVFFERNGLRHGDFPLRLSKEEMENWGSSVSLSWNISSSVLAVGFTDRVQFWTMGNYHYYLKQEVRTDQQQSKHHPLILRWHTEQPLRCAIGTSGTLLDLEYGLITCRGSTVAPYDHGSVAVIDGKILKLTPLRYANVPPPMSFCEIIASDNIVDCAISMSGSHVAILTKSMIEVYKWHEQASTAENGHLEVESKRRTGRLASGLTFLFRHSLITDEDANPVRYTQIKIKCQNDILIVAPPHRAILLHNALLRRDEKDSTFEKHDSDDTVLGFQTAAVNVENESLSRQEYGMKAVTVAASTGYQFPGDEPNIEMVRLGAVGLVCKISISRRGELFAEDRLLARGCTSFLVTDQHLIFTTSSHFLKFIHLRAEVEQLEVPADTPEVDERCRNIERGAVLITVIPSTYAVVLQMPRGNLETIFPRILVVAGIRSHLIDKDYKKAFLACRSHQVDLNLLHDYRPDTFLEYIGLFIDQLKKASWVDEFLSKLKEEDVSQTMYKDTLVASGQAETVPEGHGEPFAATAGAPSRGKINRICDAFVATIRRTHPNRHQNLITAYVSRTPSDFVSALSLISEIRKNDAAAGEKAVNHLVFLSDAARLYNVALSTYDLELTVSVAENAQMDPREYLPFLERLHAMNSLQRQYEIDHYIRNYAKALKWLHAQNKHDEVEMYTIKHNLHIAAMELYRYSPLQLNVITHRYAEYLHSQSRYMDAAMAFESLGDHSSAYQSYALAHRWREALASASLVPLGVEQLQALALSLSSTLTEETRDYRSAASIHIDYLRDIITASRLLCKGSYFAEATRILAVHREVDKLPEIIDAGLAEKFGEIIELLADCKGQLNAQVPRIKDLRSKKVEDPLAFFGGDPTMLDAEGGIPDNISLAATDASNTGGQSLFTRYGSNHTKFGGTMASNVSHKTSKTKRREERKRARGKKGSVYEEEYLIASVARLIERLNGVQDEVTRLIEGLLRRAMRERAKAVDESMGELITLCIHAKEEVWPTEKEDFVESNEKDDEGSGGFRPRGGEGVFWDSKVENQEKKEAPVVKEWRTVGLLTS
jgi:elongator complex protein 1